MRRVAEGEPLAFSPSLIFEPRYKKELIGWQLSNSAISGLLGPTQSAVLSDLVEENLGDDHSEASTPDSVLTLVKTMTAPVGPIRIIKMKKMMATGHLKPEPSKAIGINLRFPWLTKEAWH